MLSVSLSPGVCHRITGRPGRISDLVKKNADLFSGLVIARKDLKVNKSTFLRHGRWLLSGVAKVVALGGPDFSAAGGALARTDRGTHGNRLHPGPSGSQRPSHRNAVTQYASKA